MQNRLAEVIDLGASLKKQRLAELDRELEALFLDAAKALMESGYTIEQIVGFFRLAEEMADYEIIKIN